MAVQLSEVQVAITPKVQLAAFHTAARQAGTQFAREMGTQMGQQLNEQFRRQQLTPFARLREDAGAAARTVGTHMQSASDAVARLSTQIGLTSFGFQMLGQNMTRYITMPLGGLTAAMASFGIQSAISLENAQTSIKALVDPGTDVEALLGRLKKFSVESPVFDIEQVTQFTKQLVGANVTVQDSEKILDSVNKIFTTYGVTGHQAEKALLGISQVFRKGKVYSEELSGQIGEQVPIWHLLSQVTGETQASLQKIIKDGNMTSDMFAQQLIKIGELPHITKGAEEGVKTLGAQWNLLKESLRTKIADAFLQNFPAIKEALDKIRPAAEAFVATFIQNIPVVLGWVGKFVEKVDELRKKWEALPPHLKEVVLQITLAAMAAGPLASILGIAGIAAGTLVRGLAFFVLNPLGLILTGVTLALAGMALIFLHLYQNSEQFRQGVEGFVRAISVGWREEILPALKFLWDMIQTQLIPAFEDLIESLGFDSWKEFGAFIGWTLVGSIMTFIGVLQLVVLWGTFMADMIRAQIDWIKQLIEWVGMGYEAYLKWLDFTGGITNQIIEDLKTFAGQVADVYGQYMDWLGRAGNAYLDWREFTDGLTNQAIEKLKEWFGWVGDLYGQYNDLLGQAGQAALDWLDTTGGVTNGVINWIKEHMDWLKQGSDAYFDWQAKGIEALEAVFRKVTEVFTSIKEWLDRQKTELGLWSTKATQVKDEITSAFNTVRDNVINAFNSMVTGVSTAWDKVRAAVREPIRAVIGFVNDPLIKGFNIVAKAVGVGEIGAIPIPFAQGGVVPGGGYRDSVPAMLMPGEGILTKAEMEKLGGPKGFWALRAGIQHFAEGGIVATLSKLFGSGPLSGLNIGSIAGFAADQVMNAAEIIKTGRLMGVPPNGLIVAVATAMQESNLRNLPHLGARNDHDSVGLFQQRPSQGWGSVAELTNPAVSASKFFQGLSKVTNWASMSVSGAAQAVQRSAFPSAYAKWQGPATQLVSSMLGGGHGILDFLFDPVGKFIEGMMAEFPKLGDNHFGRVLGGVGKHLVGNAASNVFSKMNLAFGAVSGALGDKGQGIAAILSLVSGLSRGLGVGFRATSTFRPGDPGYHGAGRAVDFGGFNQDKLAGALYAMGGSLLELIHTTSTRGYYIKNGRPISSYGVEDERHRDHIHVAMDQGGYMQPGRSYANYTRAPEPVFTASQWNILKGNMNTGSGLDGLRITLVQGEDYVDAKIQQHDQVRLQRLRAGKRR